MGDGNVKWFDADRGYGFISQPGKPDVFVHWTGISDELADGQGRKNLTKDQAVTFRTRDGERGTEAFDVKAVDGVG